METLPASCPDCRAPASDLLFSGTMEHRVARRLQRIAPLLAILMVPLLLGWFFLFGEAVMPHMGLGFGLGWGLISAIFIPSLAVYFVSLLFPHIRQVSCPNCGWSHEFRVSR